MKVKVNLEKGNGERGARNTKKPTYFYQTGVNHRTDFIMF